MSKVKRIDMLYDLTSQTDHEGETKQRKKKTPSIPPKSDEELMAILDDIHFRNPVLANLLMMMAMTGLRFSDCSQLMYRDLYRNDKIVDRFPVIQQKTFNARVTKFIRKAEDDGRVLSDEELKSYRRVAAVKSTVTIYTNQTIMDLVELCRTSNPTSDFLFPNKHHRSKGLPIDIRNAEYHLKKTEEKLKLNYQLRTHSFRKAFSVKLVRNKVNLLKIRDLLGHANVATTNSYLSTIDEELSQAILQLNYDNH